MTVSRSSNKAKFHATAFDLLQRERDATQSAIEEVKELAKEDRYGYLPPDKEDDVYRLMSENWNSLGVFKDQFKIRKIDTLFEALSCGHSRRM